MKIDTLSQLYYNKIGRIPTVKHEAIILTLPDGSRLNVEVFMDDVSFSVLYSTHTETVYTKQAIEQLEAELEEEIRHNLELKKSA